MEKTDKKINGMPVYIDKSLSPGTFYIIPQKDFHNLLKKSGKKINEYCCIVSGFDSGENKA